MGKNSLYLERIGHLQSALRAAKAELCLIEDPVDLYYFTGLRLSAGHLVVHQKRAQLFVDGRYIAAASKQAPVPSVLVEEKALLEFLTGARGKRMLFDGGQCSFERHARLSKLVSKLKVPLQLCSDVAFFQGMRRIKDPQELKAMRASARLLYQGFEHLLSLLKGGVQEIEIARAFEIFCLENGAEKMAFDPIIAFGANSALPHHRAGKTRLKKGDVVLIDIGVVVNQYHSDMTRTLFFKSIHPLMGKVYEVVRAAHRAALELAAPGRRVGELDAAARSVMRAHGMEEYFVHSLGHGIGLETHESPRIKWDAPEKEMRLESGMVITIEPGLYFPEKGGVRYEDTVVITDKGYRNLYPEMHKSQIRIV